MKKRKKSSGENKAGKMIIRILCLMICLGIVLILIVTGINLYIINKVSDRIITLEEAKDMEADCAIVLGAGIREDKSPTWMLEDRIIVGDQLYQENAVKKIIMSGDHGRKEYDEVNTMKNYAIGEGVPSEDIFMDHAGFETYDSIYRAKEIFGAKKIIIVTQKYHLYRALYIAQNLGLEAYGVDSELRFYSRKMVYWQFREWLARVKSFGKCITKLEPEYLGETIDLEASGDVTNDK